MILDYKQIEMDVSSQEGLNGKVLTTSFKRPDGNVYTTYNVYREGEEQSATFLELHDANEHVRKVFGEGYVLWETTQVRPVNEFRVTTQDGFNADGDEVGHRHIVKDSFGSQVGIARDDEELEGLLGGLP